MKNENNISEFDQFFKQQLEGASATPPAGVWESVSSSLATGAPATAAVVKTAMWLKISAAIIATTAIVVTAVVISSNKENTIKSNLSVTPSQVIEKVNPTENDAVLSEEKETVISKTAVPNRMVHANSNKPEPAIQDPGKPEDLAPTPMEEPSVRVLDLTPSQDFFKDLDKPEAQKPAEIKLITKDTAEQPYVHSKESFVLKKADSAYLFIPDVVTPNGDGLNDEYLIDIKGEESVKIIIRDIKSTKLFETSNKYIPWNCIMPNGEGYPEGTYFVTVVYKFPNLQPVKKTITLKLIR